MPIETPQPEFRQVAALIRTAIQDQTYPPGSQLPSENELAELHDVTRATVNRALTVIRGEGLIRSERGRGTTVNPLPMIRRRGIDRQTREQRESGEARGAFAAELAAVGLTAGSSPTIGQVPAPDYVAELLGIEEDTQVLARSRVMTGNGIPITLAVSHIPLDIAEGTQLVEKDTGPGGAYSRLADLGHEIVEFTENTIVRPPSDEEARALGMDPDQRVFQVTRTARDASGRAVEVNRMVLPAHQWELNYTWAAE